MATLPLWKEGSVGLATQSRLAVTLPKGSLRRATIVVRYHQPMTPPIQKNQRLGVLVIEIPGQKTIEMPLVAEKDALAPGIWDWIMGWFKK
jgi:D-alanyl-D-alanine carboxypeptidase